LWSSFENNYREIYDVVVFDKTQPNWQIDRTDKLRKYFSKFPELAPKMKLLFERASKIAAEQTEKFKQAFEDFSSDTPIVFLPSFSFNGYASKIPSLGRSVLFIGVDVVTDRGDSIDVLFSHEFFHTYHFDILAHTQNWQTMSSPLWFEGFATYISGILNPTYSEDAILMDMALDQACSDKNEVKKWAKDYLVFFDNPNLSETEANDLYKDWFMMSGASNPKRHGYCLGLRVIQDVSKKNDIRNIVHWDEASFLPIIKESLVNLAL